MTCRRLFTVLAAMVILAGAALGCGQASAGQGGGPRSASAREKTRSGATARPAAGKATEVFGLELLRELGHGNVVFSPDSIADALAMTGTGARGETATQIAGALHLVSPSSFASVGALQQRIAAEQAPLAQGSSEAPTLSIANGLFVQRDYALEQSFAAGLAQAFATTPQTVDFMSAEGEQAINAWVAQQTRGLISQIVTNLSRETRLELANAIYLKASWGEWFKLNNSAPAPFHGEGGSHSTVFMHKTESLPYGHGRGYVALSMPYSHSTLSLLVMLPVGQSLAQFERWLSPAALDRIARGLSRRIVAVSVPRFELQLHTVLNGALQALGVRDAFDESKADFSGITRAERLKIGEVVHAADFKVDERGTLAAAATVVAAEATSAEIYEHVVAFKANRPFLFVLRDDRSGVVLFMGRLTKPTS
jgi:serpin B